MIEADSNNRTKFDSPFISGHRRGNSISAMGNYQADKTPGKSLLSSLNGGFASNQYSERDKRLLLQKVEEKQALSTKFFRSTQVSPSRDHLQVKDHKKNENVIQLNVKELKGNCERIPGNIKYQRKLIQEIETLQFGLFLGLSNLELLQEQEAQQSLTSPTKSTTIDSTKDRQINKNKNILDPPEVSISAPKHICSLFQDVNELFRHILEPYPQHTVFNNSISILNNTDHFSGAINTHQSEMGFIASPPSDRGGNFNGGGKFDLIDEEMVDIHRKFRAFTTYIQNETGFMNALVADLLWKSLYVKYEQCFGKLQSRFERETQTLRSFVKD